MPRNHREKMKEVGKIDESFNLVRKQKRKKEHKSEGDTNCT